jgi:hypothetical protein
MGGPERDRQLNGVARVATLVREDDDPPSKRAAGIVLAYAEGEHAPADSSMVQRAPI